MPNVSLCKRPVFKEKIATERLFDKMACVRSMSSAARLDKASFNRAILLASSGGARLGEGAVIERASKEDLWLRFFYSTTPALRTASETWAARSLLRFGKKS